MVATTTFVANKNVNEKWINVMCIFSSTVLLKLPNFIYHMQYVKQANLMQKIEKINNVWLLKKEKILNKNLKVQTRTHQIEYQKQSQVKSIFMFEKPTHNMISE
jgi:hypothetical protein